MTVMGLVGKNGTRLWTWTQKVDTTSGDFYWLYELIPVDDMTCDGKNDAIIKATVTGYRDIVYVLDGTNGTELWNETCWTGRMDVYTVTDLNCDGKTDVILDKTGYSCRNLRALMGDGTILWDINITNADKPLHRVADISGDGQIDLIKGLLTGGVVALAGNNGSLLWERDVSSEILNPFSYYFLVYTVGDLSCDGKTDVILNAYWFNASTNISTVFVKALDGTNGVYLWNYSINISDWKVGYDVDVVSVTDMDCDGKNDILLNIELEKPDYSAFQNVVVALSGQGGTVLWQRVIPFGYGYSDVEILSVDDVTCDGKTDIILDIYNSSSLENTATWGVMVLVGMNGTVLWEEGVTGGVYNISLDVYFGGGFQL